MTKSTPDFFPDAISAAQLEKLKDLAAATTEDQELSSDPEKFQEQIESIAAEHMGEVQKNCPHPMIAKVMILMMLYTMTEWADKNFEAAYENDDLDSSVYFHTMRDALSASKQMVRSVYLGEKDFTYPDE